MRAQTGDELTVRGRRRSDEDRRGTIIRVDHARQGKPGRGTP
jgi:hypothetical protein